MKRLENTTTTKSETKTKTKASSFIRKLESCYLILAILLLWQILSTSGIVKPYLLPSPAKVVKAFIGDFPLLMYHLKVTLSETFLGLAISAVISLLFALLMQRFDFVRRTVYPVLVITQTIPTIAIAPLLVLWLGYGIAPKVVLIIIQCFFPLAINMLTGFCSADKDAENLLKTMGASEFQIFYLLKFPTALPYIFSGIKISVSYSIITAVVSEWLGGTVGLGVYMTRVKKSYAFDKMFAVIFLVSFLSIILMKLISLLEKKVCKK